MTKLSAPVLDLIGAYARTASPGEPETLALVIQARVRETADGLRVVDRAGTIMVQNDGSYSGISDLVSGLRKTSPALFDLGPTPDTKMPAPTPTPPAAKRNLTDEMMAEAKAARLAERDRCPVSNPWLPESRNITWQMRLQNLEPDRAAKLMAEAGIAG